jgi:hypothetical protein
MTVSIVVRAVVEGKRLNLSPKQAKAKGRAERSTCVGSHHAATQVPIGDNAFQ